MGQDDGHNAFVFEEVKAVEQEGEVIIVVCEGKSERTYLQKLNRFLSENEIPLRFKSEDSEGGDFSSPMHASTYVSLLQSTIFANYKKGTLPEDLEIGQESLANLKHHNSDCEIPFHSDFADFMLNEIEQAK